MSKAISRASITLLLLFVFFSAVAYAQIAPGVQQSAEQTATITGTVTRSDGTPVRSANVQLTGSGVHLATVSDTHGAFSFLSVPYGRYRIEAASAELGTASREDILVKGDVSIVIQYIAATNGALKEIARVSTHSSGAQINVTAASIASVNPTAYELEGNTSWRELLNQIPGVTVGGNQCGGTLTTDVIPDSPFQPVVLSINGALPYETSTTLDGMSLENVSLGSPPGTGTNLSYLPMSAFDTADIVRGPGANAPSIVDSIGGSFVLHAPGRVEKNDVEFSMSNDPYGGIVSNTKIALRLRKLSAVLVYGLNNGPGPLGSQNVINAYSAFPLTIGGNSFAGCVTVAFCFGSVPNPTYPSCFCAAEDGILFSGVPINSAWIQHSGALSLSYDLTPSITAQVFYSGASSRMEDPSPIFPVDFVPGSGYTGSIAPGSYQYLDSSGPRELTQASSLLEEKLTAYMGHGVVRLAALQNNSFGQFLTPDTLPDGYYTVYGAGYYASAPSTPVYFNGTREYVTFTKEIYNVYQAVNARDLLASYAVQLGSKTTLGASYVKSYYNDLCNYSLVYSTFLNIPSAGLPSGISETTTEVRLNAGMEISEHLSLDASWYSARGLYHVVDPANAARWTDSSLPYTAPRIGATWRANQNVVIRAAAGGGYALPPITYLVGNNSVFCIAGVCNESLTNLNLQPEKSFGFDLGTDVRFKRDIILSLDLYRVNLFGQFFQTTTTGSYSGPGCSTPPCALYATQYNNLQQSRYEGINVDLRHDVSRGLYWHGALGLTRAFVMGVPPGFYNGVLPFTTIPCTNCMNTYVVPGANYNGEYESPVPYANGSMQIGYRWSPEKYVDISPTYFGNGNPYFEPAFMEFDAHGSYPITRNISLLATFRNITGIYSQGNQQVIPTLGAPTITGQPYALIGIPYGPRAVIVTLNFKE